MNIIILAGRLTRDPEIKYSGDLAIAKYGLAVDRQFKKEGEPTADFFNCTAFGKSASFAEKYLTKGMKILIEGRVQMGKYQNKEGQTVYTTDVIVERHEFCESKGSSANNEEPEVAPPMNSEMQFVNVPEDFDEELPFG